MRTHGRDKGADEERARGHEPAPTRSKMYPGRVEKGFPVPQARESERASERANDINNDSSECAQPGNANFDLSTDTGGDFLSSIETRVFSIRARVIRTSNCS
ncbi:uncharacterized protein LOC143152716 isoform X1 [Ptiloglossa arizonensis]|uniref:uncharacterized protein LOC143152716 isoform X1 n=1 Tax=Ptiloglossa arizonensis TaxID=3350558 RepID=UPI003FA1300B